MGARELEIIDRARTTLNDINVTSPRWTTKRLMQILQDGQEDMCKDIPMIVNKATIHMVGGVNEAHLPDKAVKLLTATYDERALEILAYDEIEQYNTNWEYDVGHRYSAILTNALSQHVIRPYPIVESSKPIYVKYRSMPTELGWNEELQDSMEELQISSMWNYALRQYVIGMAFLDYGDESSNSRSVSSLGLYFKEFKKAEKLAKSSFSKRSRATEFQSLKGDRDYGNTSGFRHR